jgi:DNA polymerase-3 subunit alpha
MVSGIRPHQTKTGKMMAWVTLEDMTGTIELVVFPRTWDKYQFTLEIGGVISVDGKVDAQANPAKILVEAIRTEIKVTLPAQMTLQPAEDKNASTDQASAVNRRFSPKPKGNVTGSTPASGKGSDNAPPPPENPPAWESFEPGKKDQPKADITLAETDELEEPSSPNPNLASNPGIVGDEKTIPALEVNPGLQTVKEKEMEAPPRIVGFPSSLAALNADHPPQMVIVVLRPSGDSERDIRRISRLHGTFISYPGRDRFAFHVFEEDRGHLIEFPNDTTRFCSELLAILTQAVGEENIRVEPILYQ